MLCGFINLKGKSIGLLPDNKIFVVFHERLYQNISSYCIIALIYLSLCRTVALLNYSVSILVLLEVSFRQTEESPDECADEVSILVLLEVSFRLPISTF